MTNSQLAIIIGNIWIAQSIRDKKFALVLGLFYLIVYIILQILGK